MLLVVWGHTMYFCMYHEQAGIADPVLSVICTFHVPLFLFISGVVISSPPDFRKFIVKSRRFLVPMLVVGVINALVIGRLRDFFIDSSHIGYWYLLTLTELYLLLIPFRFCKDVYDVGLALLIWVVSFFFLKITSPVISMLNIGAVFVSWPYFIAGYFCRKYGVHALVAGSPRLGVCFAIAYIALVAVLFPRIDQLPLVLEYVIAFMAIAALLPLFAIFSNRRTFADRFLLLIGNSTLDIYVYHYFFIRFINLDFLCSQFLVVEMTVTAALTIFIAYCSMLVGRLVRHTCSAWKSK